MLVDRIDAFIDRGPPTLNLQGFSLLPPQKVDELIYKLTAKNIRCRRKMSFENHCSLSFLCCASSWKLRTMDKIPLIDQRSLEILLKINFMVRWFPVQNMCV